MILLNSSSQGMYTNCSERAYINLCSVFFKASTPCVIDTAFITFVDALAPVAFPECKQPVLFNREQFNIYTMRFRPLDLIECLSSSFQPSHKYFCYDVQTDTYYSANDLTELEVVRKDFTPEYLQELLHVLLMKHKTKELKKFIEDTKDLSPLMIAYAREHAGAEFRHVNDEGICDHYDLFTLEQLH